MEITIYAMNMPAVFIQMEHCQKDDGTLHYIPSEFEPVAFSEGMPACGVLIFMSCRYQERQITICILVWLGMTRERWDMYQEICVLNLESPLATYMTSKRSGWP